MEEDVSKTMHLQTVTGMECQVPIRQKNTLIFFMLEYFSPTIYVRK